MEKKEKGFSIAPARTGHKPVCLEITSVHSDGKDPVGVALPVGDETFVGQNSLLLPVSFLFCSLPPGDNCAHYRDFISFWKSVSLHRAPLWWDGLRLGLVHIYETEKTFVIVVL